MKKENYKVSIITVSYNSVNTIEQTIKSVLKQTYRNIEYIIIDGASTDGTQQIIEKYKDRIAFYISEKDDGLYYAMNKGIAKATGDIVGIINSDDWYVEDAVENMVTFIMENGIELAYGKVVNIDSNGKKEIIGYKPLEEIWFHGVIHHPSVFVKRKIYIEYGTFNTDYKIYSDYDLLLRFYSEGVSFGFNDAIIAYFRVGGLSAVQQSATWNEEYKIAMKHIDKCPNRKDIEKVVDNGYKWAFFRNEIEADRDALSDCLQQFNIYNVIIFGIGIWGEKCYNALSQSDIRVLAFTDNNPAKWNTKFYGIDVINPAELKNRDGYVLIAVKNHGEEIKEQLNNLQNDRLHCITIDELKDMYCAKHEQRKGSCMNDN